MTATIINTGPPAPLVGPTTTSGISADRIAALHRSRKNKNIKVITAGENIRRVYEGEWDTYLPELERRERVQVANLINQGIEQEAMRIGSTMPNVTFPPDRNTRPGRQRAADRTQVVQGWHEFNEMPLKFRYRARQLITYATSPVYIRPGEDHIPIWEMWDALSTFPSDMAPGQMVPNNVIYAFKRSWQWLQDTYQVGARLPLRKDSSPEGMVDCLLYCDADEMVMIALGKDADGANMPPSMLQRVPNLAGKTCVVVPGRISLGRLMGQFDQMIGMYEAQGLIWAMHLQALKRSIFAETWLEQRPNEQAQIVSPANALTGDIGIVEGGALQTYRVDPSVQTGQALDRAERNMRQTGGIPAELGGESASNIRTARRGQQVLSSAIDYPIQEHQDILASSLQKENQIAIAIAKAYTPNTETTLYVHFGDGQITYTPADVFPNDNHNVAYAFSGVSADGLVVEGLQRVGAGVMSEESFMEIDPLVSDPINEKARIISGQLEKALLASIQQQAADPAGPYQPADLAWLVTNVRDKKMDVASAVEALQARIQKNQQAGAQGQLPPEQMQPGLATPGAPGTQEAAVPPGPGGPPPQSQQDLAARFAALRNVQRGVPAQTPAGSV